MSTAANSPGQVLKLNSRRMVAERTMAFEFDKSAGFVFKAGQFAKISWVDPIETDAEGNARAFSIRRALASIANDIARAAGTVLRIKVN